MTLISLATLLLVQDWIVQPQPLKHHLYSSGLAPNAGTFFFGGFFVAF